MLVVALVLTAGCATGFEASRWTPVDARSPIPPWSNATAWDGGLLLAGGSPAVVLTSTDAVEWRSVTPADAVSVAAVAGHGATAYLLGWTARELVVWRSQDGTTWETIPLAVNETSPPDGLWDQRGFRIAAGSRGVLVTADRQGAGPLVWHSGDGSGFEPVPPLPGTEDLVGRTFAVATTHGFLLHLGSVYSSSGDPSSAPVSLFSSSDGRHWEDIGIGLPEGSFIEAVGDNGSTTVVFTDPRPISASHVEREPAAWYRKDGGWREAAVDPGRMPDLAVAPADRRNIAEVRPWRTGFLATGQVIGGAGIVGAGIVWTSADGSSWTRVPVRENGFDKVKSMHSVAVGRETTLLVGYRDEEASLWRSDTPSS